MIGDVQDQLRVLGRWLEAESGLELRPSMRGDAGANHATLGDSVEPPGELVEIVHERIEAPDVWGSLAASVDSAEAETDERCGDDLMIDYLQLRPDDSDLPSERKRWSGVVVGVAATILVVVGVVVAADGNSGDVVTDPASSPNVEEPTSAPNPAPPTTTPSSTAEPSPDPMAVEVVADLFDASNAGDVETYIALQSQEALTEVLGLQEPFGEKKARDSFLFLYLMGAEWVLTDCTARTATAVQGDVVICQLSVDADWLRAYGLEDPPSRVRFVVDDGIVTENSASIFLRSRHQISGFALAQWLFDNYETGFTEACGGVDLADFHTTPRCAELMQLHLDEWASYLETDS